MRADRPDLPVPGRGHAEPAVLLEGGSWWRSIGRRAPSSRGRSRST